MAKHAICATVVLTASLGCWWLWRGGAARLHAREMARDLVDGHLESDEGTAEQSLIAHEGDADPVTGINSNKALPPARALRRKYVHSVVAEIKSKMGTPTNTEANRLVVRRMAHDIMRDHGMRYTAIKAAIELTIASVFMVDSYEMEAKEYTALVGDRSRTGWSSWWGWTTKSSQF